MTDALTPPASCLLRLDTLSGVYELTLCCASWQHTLPMPAHGQLLQQWCAAGLPQLCAARLMHVVRSGHAAAWPIELPGLSPEAPRRGYLLSVSPLVAGAESHHRSSFVTLAPNHLAWPAISPSPAPSQAGLRVELTLDARLCLAHLEADWEALTGHPVASSLGRPLVDFLHPQTQATLNEQMQRTQPRRADPEIPRRRLALLHSSGNLVWVEVNFDWQSAPKGCAPGEAGWRAQLDDVSDNVRTWHLDQVRDQALDQSNCGVVITDATFTHQPIVYVNSRFTEITGYTLDEVWGKPCSFLQGTDRQQEAIAPLREAIRRGERATALLRNFRKSGEMFWNQLNVAPIVDERTGVLTHHFGILNDVTETRHLLAQLSQQARLLESLHRDNPNGLIAFDEDDRVCLDNRAFVALTGQQALGLSRQTFFELLQSMAAPGQSDLSTALLRGKAVQWQVRKPRERVIEIRGSQLNAAGQPGLLVFRDISTEMQLYRLQKQFLATAAHEMRAPMGSIRGFSELMLTRNFPAEVQRDLLERIHRQSKRLSDLLNDLLNLSRIESQAPGSVKLERVELLPLLREVVHNFAPPGSESRLQLLPHPQPVWAQGQRAKLEQVLVNIVSNALKYSSARGRPVQIGLQASQDSRYWEISVADQGVGMSAQTLERLFTKFFRVDPQGDIEGTGLGLCIAKELTERMSGTIRVASQLGQGSVFTLSFLQSPAQPGEAGPSEMSAH
jgi:PAS domain S-box-containing protein